MQIERYKKLPYDQLKKLENQLSKQLGFQPARDLHVLQKYETPEEKINDFWRKNSFWDAIQSDWLATNHFFRNPPHNNLAHPYPGIYRFPVHISLNEDFNAYIENELYANNVEQQMDSSREKLEKKVRDKVFEIGRLQISFQKKLTELSDFLIEYIERNSVVVESYDPHGTGEDGRRTRKMINLIGDAETAYRGVETGNIFAYEWFIGNIFDPPDLTYMKTAEEFLDELWDHTARLLELSKEYLVLQMAVKYKTSSGNPTLTTEETIWLEKLIKELRKQPKTNSAIRSFIKNKFPKFEGNPDKDYFRGKLSKTQFALALSEIYSIKFGKEIGPKRLKQVLGHKIEKLRKS